MEVVAEVHAALLTCETTGGSVTDMLSFQRIYAIATKEWLHMVRDRLTFMSLLIATSGYVIVFGYAINPDPRHIETIIVDHDKSEFSRLYRLALQQSNYLDIDPREMSADQASDYLRRAKTSVVIATSTEPTVVQDEALNTDFFGNIGKLS